VQQCKVYVVSNTAVCHTVSADAQLGCSPCDSERQC
jgi:hypothetical protein